MSARPSDGTRAMSSAIPPGGPLVTTTRLPAGEGRTESIRTTSGADDHHSTRGTPPLAAGLTVASAAALTLSAIVRLSGEMVTCGRSASTDSSRPQLVVSNTASRAHRPDLGRRSAGCGSRTGCNELPRCLSGLTPKFSCGGKDTIAAAEPPLPPRLRQLQRHVRCRAIGVRATLPVPRRPSPDRA